MSLAEYRKKRRFGSTPEPSDRHPAAAVDGGPIYVIQRHQASHLHYDFRLEIDGVLKSWAVPKGPSLDPAVKRLAVQVEDHPLAYAAFEGVIPAGQYGAGTVQIVDRGQWTTAAPAARQLAGGRLEFTLHGGKYAGPWRLLRTGGTGTKPQWLLVRRSEGGAIPVTPTRPAAWPARLRAVAGATPRPLPAAPYELQLAELVKRAPSPAGRVCEIKWDGYRIAVLLRGGEPRLFSRSGADWTPRFPALRAALAALGRLDALLDGEVVHGDGGVASFGALQQALADGRDEDLRYIGFDLLHLQGFDLRDVPFVRRHQLLADLLAGGGPRVLASPLLPGTPAEAFASATALGYEGVIVKQRDGFYRGGRNAQWAKLKRADPEELAVVGITPPKGSRSGLGALLLARHLPGRGWVYAGKAGSGLSDADIARVVATTAQAGQREPSVEVEQPFPGMKAATWFPPRFVAEVLSRGTTGSGLLRQPTVKAIRLDKTPSEVGAARPPTPPAAERSGVVLTHPERVVFPKDGLSKRDVFDYYARVAPLLLAELADRPVSVLRVPEAVDAAGFFQKHPFAGLAPEDAQAVGGESLLRIDSAEGLARYAQLNAIEFHPWGSRFRDLEHADRLVFDLDPGPGVAWPAVRRAALELRALLADAGLEAFLRTSGGKGLHIVVPLRPAAPWAAARAFSEAVARTLAAQDPARYVATASKAKRMGRIYIDYLRNGRGATSVASYSLRARDGAPVAMPIAWTALRTLEGAAAFGMKAALAHIARRRRDPWAGIDGVKQALPGAGGRRAAGL